MKRIVLSAVLATALLAPAIAAAQQPSQPERSNKAGEVRGKERADQVRGMNADKRDAKGASKAAKEKKGAAK
ncbi:MAG: hypothetical protein JNL71_11495 [Rhodospirillales bacterium]|nr:hypothetical protein [Rhodospirillales bacterium]